MSLLLCSQATCRKTAENLACGICLPKLFENLKAALSAMTVKTDRKDARGLAQLIRMSWFRPVHAKSMGSQEVRALLVARKQLLGRLIDVEHPGDSARLWPEDRPGDAQGL